MQTLDSLLLDIRACNICAADLPHGPRPVLQVSSSAKILIAAQAPGRKVHASGVPFDDASGKRLRTWLGVTREQFYDKNLFAIVPMGFCYPGKAVSGDLAPRPECAPKWRTAVLDQLTNIELTLVIGQYAQHFHLSRSTANLTDIVRNWREHWPAVLPLPHPSPRNNIWLKRNAWFEQEILPPLRQRVADILQ